MDKILLTDELMNIAEDILNKTIIGRTTVEVRQILKYLYESTSCLDNPATFIAVS